MSPSPPQERIPTARPASRLSFRASVVLLTLLALLLRLIGLGHRALSHDESLHALYSWYLASSFHYEHDPMMHGPLLFHLNALVYTLFGAGDFTARLLPALAGTACVPLTARFHCWLGKPAALVSAALVALSPALLAYSRYLRNDIYIAAFTLLLVHAALRYRDTGAPRQLLLLALALALSFATKEVAYIHGTVLGATAVLLAAHTLLRHRTLHCADRRWADIAVTLLTLALPFAAALLHTLLSWDPLATRDPAIQFRTALLFLLLSSVSWLTATLWFQDPPLRRALIKAWILFWTLQILLYSTLLTNLPQGLTSGIAAGLGYWLAQHEVQRGAADPLFYLSLLLLYTPLLLLTFAISLRRLREPAFLVLILWTLGHFLIYSLAGERMPWLLLHITLPLCLLAGPVLVSAFRSRSPLRLLLIPLTAHLLLNSLRLNGPLADSPREPLHYAHAGENLPAALRIISHHTRSHPAPLVHVHPDFTWPLAWYLRDTPARYTTEPVPEATLRIAPPTTPSAPEWTSRGEFTLIHWPRQHWHALTPDNLRRLATQPPVRQKFLRFYLFRETTPLTPATFPQPVRFRILTPAAAHAP